MDASTPILLVPFEFFAPPPPVPRFCQLAGSQKRDALTPTWCCWHTPISQSSPCGSPSPWCYTTTPATPSREQLFVPYHTCLFRSAGATVLFMETRSGRGSGPLHRGTEACQRREGLIAFVASSAARLVDKELLAEFTSLEGYDAFGELALVPSGRGSNQCRRTRKHGLPRPDQTPKGRC